MAMALAPPWLWRNSTEQQQQEDQASRFRTRATAAAGKSRRGSKQRQRRSSSSSSSSASSSPPQSSTTTVSSTASSRRQWIASKERQVDEEFDMVVVPADGCCMSGSDSEDSDWSVGWMEPHSVEFGSDSEDSFAVLVPCYGSASPRLVTSSSANPVWAAALVFSTSTRNAAAEQRMHVEEWLSSLQQQHATR